MRAIVTLGLCFFFSGTAFGGKLCGSSDEWAVALAGLAVVAPELCGLPELEAADIGLLLRASGADIKEPQCERDLARAALGMKANHAEDPDGWCNKARSILAEHPLTAHLAQAPKCTEIGKAAGVVESFRRHCPNLRITPAGEAVSKLGNSEPCKAEKIREIASQIAVLNQKIDGPQFWCQNAFENHKGQFGGTGLKMWVEQK